MRVVGYISTEVDPQTLAFVLPVRVDRVSSILVLHEMFVLLLKAGELFKHSDFQTHGVEQTVYDSPYYRESDFSNLSPPSTPTPAEPVHTPTTSKLDWPQAPISPKLTSGPSSSFADSYGEQLLHVATVYTHYPKACLVICIQNRQLFHRNHPVPPGKLLLERRHLCALCTKSFKYSVLCFLNRLTLSGG